MQEERSIRMRGRVDYYITAAIFVSILFLCSPIVAGGNVMINWQVSGSPDVNGTIDTGLNWDEIYANPTETFAWNLKDDPDYEEIEIDLGDGHTAVIDGLSIGIKADPFIDFGFSARSYDGDTHFLFSSELLLIDPALAAGAQASAWSTPSPGFGSTILSGDFTDNKMYRATYNDGTLFTDLSVTPISNPPGGTTDWIGATTIDEEITNMQVHWGFTLSSGGSASGTSNFTITGDVVPEPVTILLLGLGFVMVRKRRV